MADPPIVIGPFDNVPAPGSPIRSDWPQEISTYVAAHDVELKAIRLSNGVNVMTTDANGQGSIIFPAAFGVAPTVVVSNGDANFNRGWELNILATTTTYFALQVLLADGSSAANTAARVNWLAVEGGLAPP